MPTSPVPAPKTIKDVLANLDADNATHAADVTALAAATAAADASAAAIAADTHALGSALDALKASGHAGTVADPKPDGTVVVYATTGRGDGSFTVTTADALDSPLPEPPAA